jgi:hypothetical protein
MSGMSLSMGSGVFGEFMARYFATKRKAINHQDTKGTK